jgi:putative FmdB family regulatory protein
MVARPLYFLTVDRGAGILLPPGENALPLYEYECNACGHRFERIQKLSASPPDCPECGKRTRRLLSAPAIRFKGSGWYVTDYARKGKPKEGGEGAGKPESGKQDDTGKKGDAGKKGGDTSKGSGS